MWYDRLKTEFEDNPTAVMAVGALVATAAAKLINAVNDTGRRRTWYKEVDRRVRNDRR